MIDYRCWLNVIEMVTYLVHFLEPPVDNALLLGRHGAERVEEVPSPHDLRDHNDLVDQFVRISDTLLVRVRSRIGMNLSGATGRLTLVLIGIFSL